MDTSPHAEELFQSVRVKTARLCKASVRRLKFVLVAAVLFLKIKSCLAY